MKTYIIPVIYTICGHIEIDAKDMEAAKKICSELNKGFEQDIIDDATHSSRVLVDEIEEIND